MDYSYILFTSAFFFVKLMLAYCAYKFPSFIVTKELGNKRWIAFKQYGEGVLMALVAAVIIAGHKTDFNRFWIAFIVISILACAGINEGRSKLK